MKSITFACISCLALLTIQIVGQTTKNEFSLEIEGVKCSVKAYKPSSPIIFEPMVDKDFRPKLQLMLAIMLGQSDISSYMSDEEIFDNVSGKFDKEQAQKYRDMMKTMYELTDPSAADNPWKGMKYVVNQAFVIESEKGKFLVYQLSNQGGKDFNGTITSRLKNVAGKWVLGLEKSEEGKKLQRIMMELVPEEFDKLHKASSIEPLPLEDLLK